MPVATYLDAAVLYTVPVVPLPSVPGTLEPRLSFDPKRCSARVRAVVEAAGHAIGGCDAVGVIVLSGDRLDNPVWSAELARRLDATQCRAGHGPAWDAVRQLQVFNVALPLEAASWPLFSRAAVALGARRNLSVPLVLRGQVLGALSLYSRRRDAFAGSEEAGLALAAEVAAALGSGAAHRHPARSLPSRDPSMEGAPR